ncbi:MAG: exonuclease SbcCD subunit D [Solobacterium sp.]|nr:exonuclease SbcCD subunit D [Solobacterium sp.]
MKIAHISDLHLGKVVNGYSMIENQRHILAQIADKVIRKEVDAVFLAGDIYDSPVPEAESMEVLNEFLSSLMKAKIDVFMIAGNHDRGDLIDYGASLLEAMDIHVCGKWKGKMECVDMLDRYGPLHVWCLPYVTPQAVNRYIDDPRRKANTFTDAVRYALSTADKDPNERNVLIAHQYIEGAVVTAEGSEDYLSLAGEIVSASALKGFDYVALGHVHTAQAVGDNTIRYCGAPLNYAISEIGQERSFTLIYLGEKGSIRISTVALEPLRPMVRLKGSFLSLMDQKMIDRWSDQYVSIVLEEEKEIPNVINVLKEKYPYVMTVSYADGRVRLEGTTETHTEINEGVLTQVRELRLKEPNQLFAEFYELRNEEAMTQEQKDYVASVIKEAFGGGENETG